MRTPSANVHMHCAHARVQRLHRHAPLRTQASKSSDEAMQVKRLQQEKDVLQRKVTRLTASIAAGGGGGASSGADEQVDYYRRMVKCTLCQENEKNAVIVKCGHTFCRDCIDDRLANRNRKCPACSQQARVPCSRRHAHADAHTVHGPCVHALPAVYAPCAHSFDHRTVRGSDITHAPSLRSSTTRESRRSS